MLRATQKILCLIVLLAVLSTSITYVSAEENENIIYMSNYSIDGGLLESYPVRDRFGNLHTFLHIEASEGEKLVHLYYENGQMNFTVIEEDALGIQIRCVYQVGIVYSKSFIGGDMVFYYYTRAAQRSFNEEITQLTGAEVLNNVFDIKVIYANDKVHLFHDYVYGPFGMLKNITRYSGRPLSALTNTFEKEDFLIASDSWKQILDYTVDDEDNIWYAFRYAPEGFGIGIGQLANESVYFKANRTFSNVLHPVDQVKIQPETGSESLSFVFTNPQQIYWGSFNGSRITENSQSTFYNNPIDISYNTEEENKTVLIADQLEDSENVHLYVGEFQEDHWVMSSIQSEHPIRHGYYSSYLNSGDFIVLYNSTVQPSQYTGLGTSYREKQAMGIFVVTSYNFVLDVYIEGLTTFNPFVEFLQNYWYIVVIIIGSLILVGVLIFLTWKFKGESIKNFLTDKSVGEYNRFALIFVNIGRFFSNAVSTIFTIWFSNKKRSLLTLAGFIITGYLLSSAIIIAQSEEPTMIKAYERSFSLGNDGIMSATVETSFIASTGNPLNLSSDYASLAKQEVLDLFQGTTFNKYIEGIESCYYVSASILSNKNTTYNFQHITALPDNSDPFFEVVLTEGRVPQAADEICLSQPIANTLEISLNDTLTVVASNSISGTPDSEYYVPLKVVGFFPTTQTTRTDRITNTLGLSDDLYLVYKTTHILTKQSFFFDIFNNATRVNLPKVYGYFQLDTSFSEFSIDERTSIVNELSTTFRSKVFSLTFDETAAVKVTNEMESFFSNFNTYYLNNMARLLIFAIPAILLSIYMVFESSELFSSSYEKEIEILRSRGLSNMRITSIYLSTRLIEILVACVASYGFAALTAGPLIKINGFISFDNPDAELVLGNILFAMFVVALVLFVISIPRIIIIVTRKRKIEKAPSTIKKILTFISWRDLFFLMLGLGLFFYFYNEAFVAYYESSISNFTTYLLLTIAGAIFTLLGGLPLVVKILSAMWKGIGYIVWKSRKRKANFMFAEISKDIRYFENITLIFLLIIMILLPVMVVPYSKETTLTEQAYFVNGSDLRIQNWNNVEGISMNEIKALEEVSSVTNVKVYTMIIILRWGISTVTMPVRMVVINQTDFIDTVVKPSDDVTDFSWSQVASLSSTSALMSKPMMEEFHIDVGDNLYISNSTHDLEIIAGFDLFPIYYLLQDYDEGGSTIVITSDHYNNLVATGQYAFKMQDDLLIRLKNPNAVARVKQVIFDAAGTQLANDYNDIKDSLKTPLYNVFIIEMILSLFVSIAVLLFSSFTTAIKILEKRVIKHDIMKKMGINVGTIINMSSIQTMLAAILPTLIIGSAVGFSVMYPTILQLSYGAVPYPVVVKYPIVLLVLLFVGVPALVYLSISYFLRREFQKYAPTMME